MSPEVSRSPEIQPRPVAYAFAKREFAELSIVNALQNSSDGHSYSMLTVPLEEFMQQSAVRVEKILMVKGNIGVATAIERVFDRDVVARRAQDQLLPILEVGKGNYTQAGYVFAEEKFSDGEDILVRRSVEGIWRQTDMAGVVALEHNTTVENVFAIEKLYKEMMRRTYTPEEFVEQYQKYVMGIREDNILRAMLAVLIAVDGQEHDIEVLMERAREDEDMKQVLLSDVRNKKKAFFTYCAQSLVRFWGPESLRYLHNEDWGI